MRIDTQLLLYCFEKTKAIVDGYTESCIFTDENPFPRSVVDLGFLILGNIDKQIYYRLLNTVHASRSKIRASTISNDQGHYIYFVSGLEPDEMRYLQAKELFQIYFQSDPFHTRDIVDLVKNMILRSMPESAELDLGHATTAETLAELAAMEFLFPLERRISHLDASGGADRIDALASMYGIPPAMIARCLNPELIETLKLVFQLANNHPADT
jgi:hypothetical protein